MWQTYGTGKQSERIERKNDKRRTVLDALGKSVRVKNGKATEWRDGVRTAFASVSTDELAPRCQPHRIEPDTLYYYSLCVPAHWRYCDVGAY